MLLFCTVSTSAAMDILVVVAVGCVIAFEIQLIFRDWNRRCRGLEFTKQVIYAAVAAVVESGRGVGSGGKHVMNHVTIAAVVNVMGARWQISVLCVLIVGEIHVLILGYVMVDDCGPQHPRQHSRQVRHSYWFLLAVLFGGFCRCRRCRCLSLT